MDYKSAAKDISKGSHLPVYLCYGTETFLLHEFISFLVDRLIPAEQRDFAVSKYDLTETALDVVLSDAETLPFMTSHKIVIAEKALFFTGAKDSGKIEHATDRLLDYVKAPAEYSVLVLTVEADKLDERKKLVKTMKQAGVAIPFPPMTADELLKWVHRRSERLQFRFGEGAAELLTLYTGGNLQTLAGEMEKLSLYTGKGGTADRDTVSRLVVPGLEQNVFILIDHTVHLRLDQALNQLQELLLQKEEPIKILALIARQFRIILQVKQLAGQGFSHQQIAGQIGQHPYSVKLAAEQSRGYSAERLQAILWQLGELDYRMKTGKIDKVLGLEMFLLGLAQPVAG